MHLLFITVTPIVGQHVLVRREYLLLVTVGQASSIHVIQQQFNPCKLVTAFTIFYMLLHIILLLHLFQNIQRG